MKSNPLHPVLRAVRYRKVTSTITRACFCAGVNDIVFTQEMEK